MSTVKSIELLEKIGNGKKYDKEYEYLLVDTDYSQYDAEQVMEQLTESDIQYINSKIDEMQQSNLYQRKTAIHGKKHIENVMLFAGIISFLEGINESDRNLLMESAKYHDQGRDNDLDEQHGIESAYIAGNDLKDKYSKEEIKIIQAAIMFHDDRTKGISIKAKENEGFNNISKRLQLSEDSIKRARIIGNILKDSDALDRTRFAPGFNPIDESFLRTETSKKLIKIAFELHEAYSIEELKIILNDETEDIVKEINDYSNATSPIRAKKYYEKNIIKQNIL